MLKIIVPSTEIWDYEKEEFSYTKPITLELEHSLLSMSKWESEYEKPFLSDDAKTQEESLFYIKCMTLTKGVDDIVFSSLSEQNTKDIEEYISKDHTATIVYSPNREKRNHKIITSEEIYSWMIALNIPFECQKWHLNRLLTLIKVCNANNEDHKVNTNLTNDALSKRAEINAARKKKLKTHG